MTVLTIQGGSAAAVAPRISTGPPETSPNATDPKAGDTVRIVFGVDTVDALVVRVEGDKVTMQIIWNDPTTPEEDIEPVFVTYPRQLVMPKE